MRYAPCEVVYLPDNEMPEAPAKTDFVKIYVRSSLDARERSVAEKHERGHILCGHGWRRPDDLGDDNEKHRAWRVACEMEIAINIYDASDEAVIGSPLSRLAGGYTRHSLPDLPPTARLAEDIYEWLLSSGSMKDRDMLAGCHCCDGSHQDEPMDLGTSTIADMVDGAAAAIWAAAAAAAAKSLASSSAEVMANRPPTLTSEMDALLRTRTERVRSYRRPSRVERDDGIIIRGGINIPKPPLVEVYVDRSGSFSPDKTRIAQSALLDILRHYGASIEYDAWYFGNDRLSDVDNIIGGNTPYGLVADAIASHRPRVAVVITDNDPVGDIAALPPDTRVLVVPIGCDRTLLSGAIGGIDTPLHEIT